MAELFHLPRFLITSPSKPGLIPSWGHHRRCHILDLHPVPDTADWFRRSKCVSQPEPFSRAFNFRFKMWPAQDDGKIKNVVYKEMFLLWAEEANPFTEAQRSHAPCWGSVLGLFRSWSVCELRRHMSIFYGKPLLRLSPVQLDIRPSPAVIVIIHSFPMSVRTRLTPACWRSMSCLRGTFSRSAPQTVCPCPGTNLNKAFILVLRLAPRDAKVRLILLI